MSGEEKAECSCEDGECKPVSKGDLREQINRITNKAKFSEHAPVDNGDKMPYGASVATSLETLCLLARKNQVRIIIEPMNYH